MTKWECKIYNTNYLGFWSNQKTEEGLVWNMELTLPHNFYTSDSDEVKNAKLSQEVFLTTIKYTYVVNGSKYKLGHWEKDIFEIVTSDGVYISAIDLWKHRNKEISVTSYKNKPDIGWIWLNYNDKDINYSDNALPRCDIDSHYLFNELNEYLKV